MPSAAAARRAQQHHLFFRIQPPVARDGEEGAQAGGGKLAAAGFGLGLDGLCCGLHLASVPVLKCTFNRNLVQFWTFGNTGCCRRSGRRCE